MKKDATPPLEKDRFPVLLNVVMNVQQENGPLLLALHPMTSVLMSALKGSGLMSQAWLLMSNAKNVPKENGLTKQDSH